MEISIPKKIEEVKKVQSTLSSFRGIYVDVHEPSIFLESLGRDKGLLVQKKALVAGDYAFSNIGIERKEFNDYMHSLTSGRLWKQMMKMRIVYERPILVVEGLKDPSVQLIGMTNIRFISSLARIVLMGINVVLLPTHAHFLSFVQYLFLSSDKKTPSLKPIPKKKWGRVKIEIKEDMLTMIPGIGRKTAMAVMARYPTLDEIMRLSVVEIIQSTPLGPKRAKILWEVFHT